MCDSAFSDLGSMPRNCVIVALWLGSVTKVTAGVMGRSYWLFVSLSVD